MNLKPTKLKNFLALLIFFLLALYTYLGSIGTCQIYCTPPDCPPCAIQGYYNYILIPLTIIVPILFSLFFFSKKNNLIYPKLY